MVSVQKFYKEMVKEMKAKNRSCGNPIKLIDSSLTFWKDLDLSNSEAHALMGEVIAAELVEWGNCAGITQIYLKE